MELKAHRGAWSGTHPENSIDAVRECYRERVARVEIDIWLHDGDFVVAHDEPRRSKRTVPLREMLDVVRAERGPTLLELDAKDVLPWPWPAVELLARLVEPVRDRVVFGSAADWNLRRLLQVDDKVPVGFNPHYYIDWTSRRQLLPGRRGVYGYRDDYPLARRRTVGVADYLRDRLDVLLHLVPTTREVHLRLVFFERMLRDGLDDAATLIHDAGALVDVWTLDAGTRGWRQRLDRAVAAGVDIVTTNTPRELAEGRPPSEASP